MLNQKTLLTGSARSEPRGRPQEASKGEAVSQYLRAAREELARTGREPEPAFLRDLWERIKNRSKS